ncbi:MAG: hypothetical protein PHX20_01555 [Candidatus Omnitrophica bacterium]|nr:hypothetical protein [Candidatus Omnitrophota bacterium]
MNRCLIRAGRMILLIFICMSLNSCSHFPLKEGGLEIGKDTTAGIDDIGVGRVTRQF